MLFSRFRSNWQFIDCQLLLNQFIDLTAFQTSLSDQSMSTAVSPVATNITAFAEMQLSQYQPREDYRELLELTIIFLGGVPSRGVSFRVPAGLHRARWMAKAMYSLKI